MCGGEGTRLAVEGEKPLLEIGGVPMIDRVIDALEASRVDSIYAVGSPAVPQTAAHVDVPYIETEGSGYVADLTTALDRVEPPVLTVAADLPLLDGPAVDTVFGAYEQGSMTVCVPTALKRELGVTVESTTEHEGIQVTPTGVNVVGDPSPETIFMTRNTRFAVNVNRLRDAQVAEALG
jgi:adenosylcobinamide-phosphate guanylyltransferase